MNNQRKSTGTYLMTAVRASRDLRTVACGDRRQSFSVRRQKHKMKNANIKIIFYKYQIYNIIFVTSILLTYHPFIEKYCLESSFSKIYSGILYLSIIVTLIIFSVIILKFGKVTEETNLFTKNQIMTNTLLVLYLLFTLPKFFPLKNNPDGFIAMQKLILETLSIFQILYFIRILVKYFHKIILIKVFSVFIIIVLYLLLPKIYYHGHGDIGFVDYFFGKPFGITITYTRGCYVTDSYVIGLIFPYERSYKNSPPALYRR